MEYSLLYGQNLTGQLIKHGEDSTRQVELKSHAQAQIQSYKQALFCLLIKIKGKEMAIPCGQDLTGESIDQAW